MLQIHSAWHAGHEFTVHCLQALQLSAECAVDRVTVLSAEAAHADLPYHAALATVEDELLTIQAWARLVP